MKKSIINDHFNKGGKLRDDMVYHVKFLKMMYNLCSPGEGFDHKSFKKSSVKSVKRISGSIHDYVIHMQKREEDEDIFATS